MTQPLFLVGARGCGKSTVGQALARKLGYAFVDTDSFLLNHTGKSVAEIVAEEGWEGFRARESDALQRVTAPATVIATGGGMVLAEGNRQFMQENGIPVWLHAPAQVLASRLTAAPEEEQRPTLTGKGITDEIVDILAAREGLYRQVGRHIVDASRAPEAVVEAILSALQMAHVS